MMRSLYENHLRAHGFTEPVAHNVARLEGLRSPETGTAFFYVGEQDGRVKAYMDSGTLAVTFWTPQAHDVMALDEPMVDDDILAPDAFERY